jgi:hypothetical protein
MKKKTVLFVCIILTCGKIAGSQELSPMQFLELSLEDQVCYFFDYYKDGHTHISVSRFAGYIVSTYGNEVIPYLKNHLKNADFFMRIRSFMI